MKPPPQAPPAKISPVWLGVPYLAFGVGIMVLHSAWLALVGYHGLILLVLARHRSAWSPRDLSAGFSPRHALLPALGLLLVIVPVVLLGRFKHYTGNEVGANLDTFGLTGLSAPLFAAYFIFINPVLEELFWRGLYFRTARGPHGLDLAFGAFHIFILLPILPPAYIAVMVLCITALGWFWRSLARRFSGLSLPILSHMAGDAAMSAIVAILYYS